MKLGHSSTFKWREPAKIVYEASLFAGGGVRGVLEDPLLAIAQVLDIVGALLQVILIATIHRRPRTNVPSVISMILEKSQRPGEWWSTATCGCDIFSLNRARDNKIHSYISALYSEVSRDSRNEKSAVGARQEVLAPIGDSRANCGGIDGQRTRRTEPSAEELDHHTAKRIDRVCPAEQRGFIVQIELTPHQRASAVLSTNHVRFLRELRAMGRLLMAGTFVDDPGAGAVHDLDVAHLGNELYVICAASDEQAKAIAAHDPLLQAGAQCMIRAWTRTF